MATPKGVSLKTTDKDNLPLGSAFERYKNANLGVNAPTYRPLEVGVTHKVKKFFKNA